MKPSLAGPAAALLSFAVTGPLAVEESSAREARERPSVLYVMSDEHRWQSMSFTELPELRTPAMERLAAEGTSFDTCLSNYPVCTPHRAMVMTGRWPYQTKVEGQPGMIGNNLVLHAGQPTLAQTFHDAGYRTGYVGKWHLGGVDLEPFGFDHARVWTLTDNHWNSYYQAGDQRVLSTRYNATHMTDQAIEFLQAAGDAPFFLMLSWNPPHEDMEDPPPDCLALYPDTAALPTRANHAPRGGRDALHELIREVGREEAVRRLAQRQGEQKARRKVSRALREMAREASGEPDGWSTYRGYHAHVSAVDRELGRLLAALEELGRAQDTVVVYTSDHGTMLGSHGHYKKRFPYEESIRTPFLVRWPGRVPAGARSDALFGTIDILPTLCGLAGLAAPAEAAGLDFSPTLLGGEGPRPASQYLMNVWDKVHKDDESPYYRGVRTERYTYAITAEGPWLLFDNRADPYQQRNLVAEESLHELRAELRAMIEDWVRVSGDPFELPPEASSEAR